ncbi:PREDICTED: myotubularin-related protein 11 isoform X1 [Crocodylus porosus]|uniref:myotubularin-related protein 11 isoform X1 n=1 Tax=Crocodylus porosus TaxID=8502 RepID=UPI0009404EFB|nr:PREDICTED: myotubularin-related protein 11 isoform X1 [Crocodylus porosus]
MALQNLLVIASSILGRAGLNPTNPSLFLPHQQPRGPKFSSANAKRNRPCQAFPGIPGEFVLEAAPGVRRSLGASLRFDSILGTLFCTNRRVAFVPDVPPGAKAHPRCSFLHSEYDVALPCIGKLVAASSVSKAKVLTASSSLKFVPEELVLYCRDFRVLHFRFPESGLEPGAFRVTMAIARAQESDRDVAAWSDPTQLRNLENAQRSPEEEEDPAPTLLFESLQDWEQELRRLGPAGWRVSVANERFDMATSLPRYLWVPSQLLDNELKRAFAHFNQRRIPRLCWRHPGGSDLLRAASFHAASDPEKEDTRAVEALLLAGHARCVVVDTVADLPSPTEIQLAHVRLRTLCLPDPAVADEKWLSALEGTRWLDHVRACVRKASDVAVLLAERRCSVVLQESDDRDLNCLVASLVQLLADPHARTQLGFQNLVQREWVAAGHPFAQRLNLCRDGDRGEAPVFQLFLDCTWQLLRQFPAAFAFAEAYLLALHDSSYVPFFSTFLFSCQWERSRRGQHRAFGQLYTPVNGWRDAPNLKILPQASCSAPAGGGACLPSIWTWALHYSAQQRAQFQNTVYTRASDGHTAPPGCSKLKATLSETGAVFLLARGALAPQPHLFPWKNGSLVKKGPWRVPSSDSLSDQQGWPSSYPALLGEVLVPACVGPAIQLWRRCYLRGSPERQHGLFPPTLSGLTEELELLQECLNDGHWRAAAPPSPAESEEAGSPLSPSR